MVQAGEWTIRRPDEIKSAGHVGRWAVVVGEGEDRRPGARTRLRETLEGIGRVIPPERTLVVGLPGHARDQASHVDEEGGPHVLDEPDDRGTGAAVLLADLARLVWSMALQANHQRALRRNESSNPVHGLA